MRKQQAVPDCEILRLPRVQLFEVLVAGLTIATIELQVSRAEGVPSSGLSGLGAPIVSKITNPNRIMRTSTSRNHH